jgi:serpin B
MKSYLCLFTCLIPLLISANNPQGIVENNNKFAFKLYNELKTSSDKNLFYSPFSISTALAMVYAGARNETALQISQTMNFQQSEKFHSDYKHLLDRLDEGTEGKFLDYYFDLVKSNYRSDLNNIDFTENTEREKVVNEINAWVMQKTNDKIKDLLSQSDVDSQTKLVLVNAIYFYGDWATAFEKQATQPKNFFLSDQTQINVPFMNQNGMYNYYEDSEIKAIEIPYKDSKASVVVFLPNTKNGISEFEGSFDYKYYQDIISAFQYNDVRLSLPKFQTTYKIFLGTTLSHMGMPLAFSSSRADFSGMTGKRDLWISEVIHQAFINVDEKGTEAAAATAVIMKTTSARPSPDMKVFNVDHPFIFLIKDNTTGSILFMGKIMNPKVSK